LTGDVGNDEASFSFGDDGSETFLNFETGGDDVGSGASLSFDVAVWLNGDISWFCGIVEPSKIISRRFPHHRSSDGSTIARVGKPCPKHGSSRSLSSMPLIISDLTN
jgi:hypothetical protein